MIFTDTNLKNPLFVLTLLIVFLQVTIFQEPEDSFNKSCHGILILLVL